MAKSKLTSRIAVVVGAIALAAGAIAPVQAHHAVQAQFEVETRLTTQGDLTRIQLVNPHPQLYFDLPGEDGEAVNWRIEAPAIAGLRRMGILRILKVGESYSLEYAPARNGEPNGLFRAIVTEDGRRFGSEVADPNANPA